MKSSELEPEPSTLLVKNLPTDIELVLQNPYDYQNVPTQDALQDWANVAVYVIQSTTVIAAHIAFTLRIVDQTEGQQLNHEFRGKPNATNVLSFPCFTDESTADDLVFDLDPSLAVSDEDRQDVNNDGAQHYLGDLVICQPVMQQEAAQQGKSLTEHWAHLLIHGLLHLLGYDHQTDEEAAQMEQQEITILQQLGFANPYLIKPER
ncbi:MAG TPA: rRNA maturation RNase YbeY [Thiothrix sp.]|nr:rRNA maturation RNase YbeY [Thiothrix sp.]